MITKAGEPRVDWEVNRVNGKPCQGLREADCRSVPRRYAGSIIEGWLGLTRHREVAGKWRKFNWTVEENASCAPHGSAYYRVS